MNSKWLVLALPKSLLLAAGSLGCFEVAPEPRQFTAWQLKAALKWALVSSGCHKSPRLGGGQGRVRGWGLCSSAVPQGHGHEGARALQWGFQRDTQDYFLLPFPQHCSEIYLYHLNCRLFPSSVRFWAELIQALTCTPWANRCPQLLAKSRLGNLSETKLLGTGSAGGGRGIHCWLSPGGCTLCQKTKQILTHYLSLEIAALLNTADLAWPRAPPELWVGGQLSLCSRTSVRDVLHSHSLIWDDQSSSTLL